MVHSIPRPSCVPTTGQIPESSVHTITVQSLMTKGHALGWAGSEAAFLALKLQQISVSYTMATEHRVRTIMPGALKHLTSSALVLYQSSLFTLTTSFWAKAYKSGPANNWLLDRTSSGPAAIAFCQLIAILFTGISRLDALSMVLAVKFPNNS